MDPALLSQLKDELLRCESLPSAEREARLAEVERTSPELARELRSLLGQSPLLEIQSPGLDHLLTPLHVEDRDPGTVRHIGPYRIGEVLGVGGMAIVYRAEQEEPLRREVAIKLLRGGLDPARVLARFTAERRAMALLEHPSIARILDAGLDSDGMPYLVTELVRGVPISEYCRARRPSVADILRLMIEVCRAVQHAHQKGIIHRDLKPSNILVAEVDGAPRPKVIDFGIARILEEESGPSLTLEGQAIGTLGYMSPEQAAGRSRAIDTRTDVYSLGAVLYELLTGSLPHAVEGLDMAQALAVLGREEPSPFRHRLPKGQSRDADLETIVMKALAREPEARYAGAGALADDLQRYLDHEAILARPPSTLYELGKLIRRNRTAFILGASGVLLVAVFAVAMAVLYAGQRRAREQAQVESARAATMNSFLLGMLNAASPGALGRSVTVREALDRAIPTVDRSFAREPRIQAEVTTTLGVTYRELGQYAIADSLLRRGLELDRRAFGPRSIEVARGLRELASNSFLWRHRQEADSLCRVSLTMSEDLMGPRSLEVESDLLLLGDIQTKLGHEAVAESILTRYLDLARARHGESSLEVGRGLVQMAMARTISDKEFGSYYRSALKILTRTLGPDHIETLEAQSNYGDALLEEGRLQEAIALQRNVLARMRRSHGDSHPKVGEVLYRLGRTLGRLGEYKEAEADIRESLEIWRAALGEESPLMAAGYSELGGLCAVQGRADEGEHWLRRSLEVSLKINSPEHPRSVAQMEQLADHLAGRGKDQEAETLYRRAIEIRRRSYGTSAVTMFLYLRYGLFLLDRGGLDSARVYFAAAAEGYDPTSPYLPVARSGLALCMAASGQRERADSLLVAAASDIAAGRLSPSEKNWALSRILAYWDSHGRSRLADPYRGGARGAPGRSVASR